MSENSFGLDFLLFSPKKKPCYHFPFFFSSGFTLTQEVGLHLALFTSEGEENDSTSKISTYLKFYLN